jgi:hypothetical protein
MSRRKGSHKDEYICVRVTLDVKDSISREAMREGLNPSEWLRNLVVNELNEKQPPRRSYPIPGGARENSEDRGIKS